VTRPEADAPATDIAAIRILRDYRRALTEIEGLMHASRGNPEGDRLDALATVVEAFEQKRYRLVLPATTATPALPP
jgi:HTH-type transcriptional regulator/antitoxin HigA